MYASPDHTRIKRINLSLNTTEMRLVEAVSEFHQMQPSACLRELVMAELARLAHAADSGDSVSEKPIAA